LENMLTVRVHLDDTDLDNGALKVLPGSHLNGRLSVAEIEQWRKNVSPCICAVVAGDLLLMRPLLLHASAAAIKPAHRRVIHLEFAAQPLSDGLEWYGS
jgi:ectoine hydroxylase-related dioxygenase (phytanoyl-CoA dioxygenase family)